MKIKEISEKTKLSVSTIRYYDSQNLIPKHYITRLPNNHREFSADAVDYIQRIHSVIQAGVSIKEIQKILNQVPESSLNTEQIDIIYKRVAEIELQIKQLNSSKEYLLNIARIKKKF